MLSPITLLSTQQPERFSRKYCLVIPHITSQPKACTFIINSNCLCLVSEVIDEPNCCLSHHLLLSVHHFIFYIQAILKYYICKNQHMVSFAFGLSHIYIEHSSSFFIWLNLICFLDLPSQINSFLLIPQFTFHISIVFFPYLYLRTKNTVFKYLFALVSPLISCNFHISRDCGVSNTQHGSWLITIYQQHMLTELNKSLLCKCCMLAIECKFGLEAFHQNLAGVYASF